MQAGSRTCVFVSTSTRVHDDPTSLEIKGVDLLVGRYEPQESEYHGERVFKKHVEADAVQAKPSKPVYLYFYSGSDWGEPGWWFGNEVGGRFAWAYAPGVGSRPAKQGWCVPITGHPPISCLRVRLSRLSAKPSVVRSSLSSLQRHPKAKARPVRPKAKGKAKTEIPLAWVLNPGGGRDRARTRGGLAARKKKAINNFTKVLLGTWSGVSQSGEHQTHEIAWDEGSKFLWCTTWTEGQHDSKWSKIGFKDGIARWGKSDISIDPQEYAEDPNVSELRWRSEQRGTEWLWRRQRQNS
eukprot:TRINITY_DN17551_c0_g1_i1.p2 TRINITY_DN17551_c0_g1~~TRINITY_DN17551_c0_g1_i1.p2  ORF type:complete len:296 (+),score=33.73 TRINITY_DN17551_c0_g1_i1:1246-2133(+)